MLITKAEPLVSIIIPVYNVESYLRECVDSVIRQTYVNLEIILVDDGSTDSSGSVCDEYAHRDQRARVIHKQNGGISSARNAGFDASHGEYVFFLDSDDYIAADTIECLVESMEIGSYDFISFEGVAVRDGGENDKRQYDDENYYSKKHKYASSSANQLLSQQLANREFCPCVWLLFLRRSFLINNNIRFYHGIIYEDVLYSFYVYCMGKQAKFVHRKLYFHRIRSGSIIDENTKGTPQSLESLLTIYHEIEKFLRHTRKEETERIYIINIAKRICRKYCQLNERDQEAYKHSFQRFKTNVLFHFAYGSSSLRLLCLPKPLRSINEWKIHLFQ